MVRVVAGRVVAEARARQDWVIVKVANKCERDEWASRLVAAVARFRSARRTSSIIGSISVGEGSAAVLRRFVHLSPSGERHERVDTAVVVGFGPLDCATSPEVLGRTGAKPSK